MLFILAGYRLPFLGELLMHKKLYVYLFHCFCCATVFAFTYKISETFCMRSMNFCQHIILNIMCFFVTKVMPKCFIWHKLSWKENIHNAFAEQWTEGDSKQAMPHFGDKWMDFVHLHWHRTCIIQCASIKWQCPLPIFTKFKTSLLVMLVCFA